MKAIAVTRSKRTILIAGLVFAAITIMILPQQRSVVPVVVVVVQARTTTSTVQVQPPPITTTICASRGRLSSVSFVDSTIIQRWNRLRLHLQLQLQKRSHPTSSTATTTILSSSSSSSSSDTTTGNINPTTTTSDTKQSATTIKNNNNRYIAKQYVQEGMNVFRNSGNVQLSIQYFNMAESYDPSITPYLWQRGLAYYYNQQYALASQQFRIDVNVNPYDVEEIVWDIASQLQLLSSAQQSLQPQLPIPNQLSLPPGSNDRRKIMGYVYRLFRGEGTEEELAMAGHSKDASLADEFYSLFYLSLYNEVMHPSSTSSTIAELYMRQALATKYAKQSNDYMVSCAKVQSKRRNWT